MRSAVLDLGSNTFHLLVADVDAFGIRNVLFDAKVPVRIGADVFATGQIAAEAYARGIEALDELLDGLGHVGRDRCHIVATGVFRHATNGGQFLAEAQDRHGMTVELLDGADEARLTWVGVSAELAGSHGRLAVVDIGGGSLECVAGTTAVDTAHSLPLGVLRLRGLGPDAVREIVAARVEGAVAGAHARALETVAISSGTARALLRVGRRLGLIAEGQRHLWRRTLADLARGLALLSPRALASLGVPAARLDTIATGAIVFDTVAEMLGRPVVYVARSALREGVLVDQARQASWGRRAAGQ